MFRRKYASSAPNAPIVPMGDPVAPTPIVNHNTGGVAYDKFEPVVIPVVAEPAPAPITTIYNTIAPTTFTTEHIFPTETPITLSANPLADANVNGLLSPAAYQNVIQPFYTPAGEGGGSGGGSNWSQYPALQDVDIANYRLANVGAPIAADDAATKAYVDAAGSAANWATYKAVQAVDMSNNRITNMASPISNADATTKLYVDTTITSNLSNWSAYPATSDIDVAGFQMNNIQFINAVPANNNPVFIYNPNNLGSFTPDVNCLIVAGGDNRADISNSGVSIGTQKNITRGTIDYGSGETIGTFATFGKDTADNDILYARVVGVATNPTAGITLGRMNLGVRSGATNLVITQLDASANEMSIQGNSGTRLNMNSKKLVNVPTPVDGTDAANKTYVDTAVATITPANWALYKAVQNVDMSANKITNMAAPTAATDAATKAYVDASGGLNWALYKAVQNVDMSANSMSNITNITGPTGVSGKVVYPSGLIDMCGNTATLVIGQNPIYNRVTAVGSSPAGLSVNDPFTAGDANQTAYHFATIGTTQTSALFTMCRKGAFTNMFGTQGTAANNTFVIASQTANCDFEIRRNVGIAPANLTGGTLLAQFNRNGQVSFPLLSNVSTANSLYYNSATGLITYGAAPAAGSTWSTYPATTNVDMSGFAINKVSGLSNASGTLNIGADDLNLNCTGLTSVLNINSTLGTAIVAGGAVDITAGGTTAINSTGNITIGSLGTTSIENFNLNNSVLTKVPATADLELNNISKIVNNSARIDISSSIVAANKFEFSGTQLASGGGDLTLNNIGTLNSSLPGTTIDSKATLQVSGTGLTDAVGFKTSILTASTGDSIGCYIDQTTATAAGGNAVGIYVAGTTANNTDGQAVGISVQTILGGTGVGDYATGVEVAGSMTGTTKRGFYEHSATAGVVNTFVHPVGVGADPNASYLLDVNGGNARITNTAANPVSLLLENVEGGAAANIMRIYKNSSTPAVNDVVGNLQFAGNNASGTLHNYANIQAAILNTTAGAEDGEMRLRATINSTATDFIHIDGSNSVVDINPGNNAINFAINDTSGSNLMFADATAQNVMFKNYPQRYIYDICGNYTLTLPNAFNVIRIVAWGAGGGGGSGYKGAANCYGGGAGAGGNGGEVWYDRRELLPDASGSITLYITPGQGGAGGAGVTTAATNGNNGSAGGATYVNLDTFGASSTKKLLTDTLCAGGNGGSGGTTTSGAGGTQATFTGDRNIGSQGRAGASSSITGIPTRNTTALLYNGSCYSQTGGSGAGGGVNSAGTTGYDGGTFVSPCGQKYNGLGANVNKAGAVNTGVAGGIVSFDNISTAAIRPPVGMGSVMAGGGAATNLNQASGAGGGWTYGTPGSRGDGGGGGGGNAAGGTATSGAGGRGADGCVYITIW